MTSIGFAPGPPFPAGVETVPRSSILLNPHERPVIQVQEKKSLLQPSRGRPPGVRVVPPPIQTNVVPPSPNPGNTSADGDQSPRIRFAPLPDPHRPRSLSTGHNVGHRASEGPNGEREYTLELRNMTMEDDALDDNALDEDANMSSGTDDDDDDDHDDYDWERDGRRRSWAVSMGSMSTMGMGSAWSGTKKLVGLKDTPQKKKASGSTSPQNSATFLSAGRRGSTASTGSNSSSSHRRAASSEAKPAKMLNGRVYGARRASEVAAMDKIRREQNEPVFVEWSGGRGVGSANRAAAGGSISRSVGSKSAFDDDDGGGMSWVRKRREERERKAREEREAALAGAPEGTESGSTETDPFNPGMSPGHRPESVSSQSSTSSQRENVGGGPLTPHDPPGELGAFSSFGGFGASTANKRQTSLDVAPDAHAAEHDAEQHLHTIKIPGSRFRRRSGDDDEEEVGNDDEDDGDFDDDDDEEVELVGQKCAAAAGVEVLARHF